MWFRLTDQAGKSQIVATLDGYDEALFDIVDLGVEPGEFDDFSNGNLVRNAKRAADTLAGPAHIAEARALKYLEALVILSGVTPSAGLLVAEAAEKQTTPAALAALVIAKRTAFIAAEVARQRGQAGID